MAVLPLSIATGPYDRVAALRLGEIKPEGIDLQYHSQVPVHGIFVAMAEREAWDASELSLALYTVKRARALAGGEPFPFTAIPVFPSRVFRHGNIFINRQAGIATPKDLEGKRIGIQEYRQSAGIWIRGILRDEYNVDTETIQWVEGGVNEPRSPTASDIRPDREINITRLKQGDTLSDALATGEIDAIIAARQPTCAKTSDDVLRLIPDYRDAERAYFEKTGIFPIMHTLVIRDAVYNENPWIAKSLFNAFEASKAKAAELMAYTGAMVVMTPWLLDAVDEMNAIFDGDAWPYGLEANRRHLDTFTRYLVEEGFLPEAPALDDLFVSVG
ncbi:MAG: ABC transporter substrate-binding protein [Alphaproteobacteria bacterium]|nr:ABC transporter substrate-binding protein [Alphaproteobacteria bacterium]